MRMTPAEIALMLTATALLALAVTGPPLLQPADYHAFADQRVLAGVPFAMDVLSNLPFAVAGLVGAVFLWRAPSTGIGNVECILAALFFAGLVAACGASTWYHLAPDDAGLAVDRVGMSFAFAGLLGLVAATKVSARAGAVLGLAVLLLAPLAVCAWSGTGNVLPWAAVQFGGMAVIVALAFRRTRPGSPDIAWVWVVAAYGAAKVLEMHDHQVFELTNGWLSGHTLKHVVAAFAACPVIACIRKVTLCNQNAGTRSARRIEAGTVGQA